MSEHNVIIKMQDIATIPIGESRVLDVTGEVTSSSGSSRVPLKMRVTRRSAQELVLGDPEQEEYLRPGRLPDHES